MKDVFVIAVVCLVLVCGISYTIHAEPNASNLQMKVCLDKFGYDPNKFDNFDFSKAASCHSDYRIAKREEEYKNIRTFLKERPWYKGRDWQWEDCAKDNTCTNRYKWWSTEEN